MDIAGPLATTALWLVAIATVLVIWLPVEAAWRAGGKNRITAVALATLLFAWVAMGVGLGVWP